ncbi:MAG: hypothetical protein A2148_07575 [Chloroflexi bacterium RBG_16_68_14]|nr:MAG: hypothetical protein A2148_07575 [Chloroflexi bacterium RBG_16_68_14]
MADLILYTLRTCPTCERARRDLAAEGVHFEERVIDDNAQWFEEASRLALTVPILVRGDSVEVGWKGEIG